MERIFLVLENQRIAAGEQHVVDLRIFGNVFQSRVDIERCFVHIVAEQPLPETETAICAANFGHQQQGSGRIFMLATRSHIVQVFFGGIPATVFIQFSLRWG